MDRIDIVISDNIAIRCGCRDERNPKRNPTCRIHREIVPADDGKHVEIIGIIECSCGATWVWGEP